MISTEFRKEEYWQIKWPLLSLVFALVLSGGLLIGLNSIDTAAGAELRRARSNLDGARNAVDRIAEEEATIIEFLGRYREMEQKGVLVSEDRLQLQESLAELRLDFDLFPVSLNIGGQAVAPLEYPQDGTEAGRQILLNSSLVEFSLPLLHEDDLTRLLMALLERPGLLQPLSCSLTANNAGTTSFIYLAQHFNASCSFHWYTFALPPPLEETE